MNTTKRRWYTRLAICSAVLAAVSFAPLSGIVAIEASASVPPTQDTTNSLTPDADSKLKDKRMHHKRKQFHLLHDAAAVIGIDKEALKKELKAGKSIAEVAKAKGIGEADLFDRLLAQRIQKLDEAVKAGKLPQEKAERMKERLPEHLKTVLNRKGWDDVPPSKTTPSDKRS